MNKKRKQDYPEYAHWRAMIYRCYPSDNISTSCERKGVGVCDRWRGWDGFWNFLKDLGEKPSKKYRLKRKDKNSDFSKRNCTWSKKKTYKVKSNEIKTNVKTLFYKNKEYTVRMVCEKFNLKACTVYYRIKAGWLDSDIVETPVNEIPISLRTEENMKYGRYSYFLKFGIYKNSKSNNFVTFTQDN